MQQRPRVTGADIARIAGVGRAAVSNWRKRYVSFPAAVGGTAASPQFDLEQVEHWLVEEGKLPEMSTEDRLWRHLQAAAGDPAEALAVAGDHLSGTRPLPYTELRPDLDDLAKRHGERGAFEELWRRFADLPGQRSVTTPDALADLMSQLAEVRGGAVLDPACGTGRLLRSAVRAGAETVYGQDNDPAATRLARLWLTVNDVPGEIRTDDSLRRDAFGDLTVDVVVGNLPFGLTNWGHEELGYDRRWEYGVPPRTEPELAWVQHALAHLKPGGRAVVLMPPSAASRRAGRRIRAELLRRGAIRSIIALPPGAAAPHSVGLHLWVLVRATQAAPDVRLIDASSTPLESILDESGNVVPVVDLLDDEVDLSPGRHAPATDMDEGIAAAARESHDRLSRLIATLPDLMPPAITESDPATPLPAVSIGDLMKAGSVQLLGPIRNETDEITTRPGDLVIPILVPELNARVVTEDGHRLDRNAQLLRCDPKAIDPWFLAGYLRTSANGRQTSRVSVSGRFDIRRAQVPRIPLAEQRHHGELFQRMQQFDDAVRMAAALSDDFTRRVVDGLANGLLRPGERIDGRSVR